MKNSSWLSVSKAVEEARATIFTLVVRENIDYILACQVDRRLVRNTPVRRFGRKDSEHNLMLTSVRLLGHKTPNRRERNNSSSSTPAGIDLQGLVADPQLRKDFRGTISPIVEGATVDELSSALTTAVMSTAAD